VEGIVAGGAPRRAFARASATSKTVRLVMDFDEDAMWLEEGDQPHLVQSKDVTGTGGAEAATATATLTASVQTMQQQMVAAIDRTTAAVESTVQVLKDIASNTADMGAVFV
jgi:hypothetical protein